jgi:uncharacterized protein YicC (UPF0701 family)
MDLAIAIWRINPASEYLLSDDESAILEWRWPGEQPTQAELQAAWDAYVAEQAVLATETAAARAAQLEFLGTKLADHLTAIAADLAEIDADIPNAANARERRIMQRQQRLIRRQRLIINTIRTLLAP